MSASAAVGSWRDALAAILPVLGHRNWIVIADSAYPAHAGDGIEVMLTREDHTEVVRSVLTLIEEAPHVSATALIDKELAFVDERDAPGVQRFREDLARILSGVPHTAIDHEEIIATIAKASAHFRVIVMKTQMSKPYTSVFIELGCGYWNAEQEHRLRLAMPKPTTRNSKGD